jgi:glycosyltransferase involved in cell wall biosynthesis
LKNRIIFFTQLPPPYAGPEAMTEMFLDYLRKWDENIVVINSRIKKRNFEKGKFDISSLLRFLVLYIRLISKFVYPKNKIIYLTIACGKIGFLRDFVVIMTSYLFRKDIVVHLHGANFDNFYKNSGKFIKYLVRMSWSKAKIAIALSETLKKNQFINIAPEVRFEIVPNGVDVKKYLINNDKYNRENIKICFLSSLSFTKGFYDLITVYKKLRNKYGEKISFNFAGEISISKFQLSEFLNKDIKNYYLKNHAEIINDILKFVDKCGDFGANYWGVINNNEKKSKFFNESDIFILPSYMEGVSMAMLEAMAFGLPVITTTVGGHPDVIEENMNGLLIQPADKEKLFEKIEYLLVNPDKRKEYGINNMLKISNEYNGEISAKKLYNIFKEII